jgi:hypothetical protein
VTIGLSGGLVCAPPDPEFDPQRPDPLSGASGVIKKACDGPKGAIQARGYRRLHACLKRPQRPNLALMHPFRHFGGDNKSDLSIRESIDD